MSDLSDKPWLVPGHMYQYDIGWLIEKLLSFETELNTAIDLKTIHYADPIQWDITTQYSPNTVVVDPKTGTAYMSKVPVPAGVLLTNTDYWVVIFNYQRIYDKIMSGVAFNDKDNLNASRDILVNDLVWFGGDLYRCTRDIAKGTTYIPGTNITPTTIADCLATYYGRDRVAQVLNDTVNVSGDYTLNAGDIAETASHVTIHSTLDMLLDADSNLTEHVAGGKTSEVGGKLTEHVTSSREIDVDGDDTIHVDGVTSINRGGAVTEVYGSSVDKRVTGAFTESFEDTAKSIYNGKRLIESSEMTANINKGVFSTANTVVNYNKFKFTKNNKVFDIDDAFTINMHLYGCDNTGTVPIDGLLATAAADNVTLFFPAGKYLITTNITLPGNIKMFGVGATFIYTADGCVTLTNGENGYINNIVFDGRSTGKNALIVDVNAAGVVLENCSFFNFTNISVKIGNSTKSGGHQWLINCKIYNPKTLATCLSVRHPDVKIIGCEFYYTWLAIELHTNILFVTSSHLWSGGASMNDYNTDIAILADTYAQLILDTVYIDSFTVGIKGAANLLVNAKNIYLYYDAERTFKTNHVIGFLFQTWSKYNIDYIAAKTANVTIYPISFTNIADFINCEPELYLKNERSLANEYIAPLSTATNTANHQNRTALFKGQNVTAETWYHVGWIVPNDNSWVRVDFSDGKNTASIDMYFDRARTVSNIDPAKNKTNSDSWSIGVGNMETVSIAGTDVSAYPIFISSVTENIAYSVLVKNYNTTWVSIFNGVKDKAFNPLFTINHV